MIQPEQIKKDNVILDMTSKRKLVIGRTIGIIKVGLNPTNYEYLGNRPHFDGDMSYLCGSDYCRCTQ